MKNAFFFSFVLKNGNPNKYCMFRFENKVEVSFNLLSIFNECFSVSVILIKVPNLLIIKLFVTKSMLQHFQVIKNNFRTETHFIFLILFCSCLKLYALYVSFLIHSTLYCYLCDTVLKSFES